MSLLDNLLYPMSNILNPLGQDLLSLLIIRSVNPSPLSNLLVNVGISQIVQNLLNILGRDSLEKSLNSDPLNWNVLWCFLNYLLLSTLSDLLTNPPYIIHIRLCHLHDLKQNKKTENNF